MLEKLNRTQHEILNRLLVNKKGLTINALADFIAISRNAVQQHIFVLERDGYLRKKQTSPTAGRPAAVYELTDQGVNYFPKQYAWFLELMLSDLIEDSSPERLSDYMNKLGEKLAARLKPRFSGNYSGRNIDELRNLMLEMGYQACVIADQESGKTAIDAFNCVFHDLAKKHPEICGFDTALISTLLNKPIVHASCMAKGDCRCRFLIEEDESQ